MSRPNIVLIHRTCGGGAREIRNHEMKGEITSFGPCYTRLAPDQRNNIVLPSSQVSTYLDKALKVLGLVSPLNIIQVPHIDRTAHRSSNFIHHAGPPDMVPEMTDDIDIGFRIISDIHMLLSHSYPRICTPKLPHLIFHLDPMSLLEYFCSFKRSIQANWIFGRIR